MKPKILVIDDEKNTRDGLREALADDYDVLLAEDGIKGLALLDANPDVCIALTDLRMPGMDGMDFIRNVTSRKNARFGNTSGLVSRMAGDWRRGPYAQPCGDVVCAGQTRHSMLWDDACGLFPWNRSMYTAIDGT